jgi:hypothetical protein
MAIHKPLGSGGGGNAISTALVDVPADGNEYVLKNGVWTIASGGGGGPEVTKFDIALGSRTLLGEVLISEAGDVDWLLRLESKRTNGGSFGHTSTFRINASIQTAVLDSARTLPAKPMDPIYSVSMLQGNTAMNGGLNEIVAARDDKRSLDFDVVIDDPDAPFSAQKMQLWLSCSPGSNVGAIGYRGLLSTTKHTIPAGA